MPAKQMAFSGLGPNSEPVSIPTRPQGESSETDGAELFDDHLENESDNEIMLGKEVEDESGLQLKDTILEAPINAQKQTKKKNNHRSKINPCLDFLINADTQPGKHCQRQVFNFYFDNMVAGENLLLPIMAV
ncbi:hypothetical protein SERLA73DRAFT_68336 [Serpula lacrymans var. lacrymans S7.3]|uniref:Uncharacterized protein n=1 Tax=Serpula lacrymans var. lacrymans (strain S7.3) TaxID=936435 RepID=F8PEY0_SERL3|nr:hypothetical protein SERLA73DRAFT_68336 [Serpula lacrymans var. lacrymans S7.3]